VEVQDVNGAPSPSQGPVAMATAQSARAARSSGRVTLTVPRGDEMPSVDDCRTENNRVHQFDDGALQRFDKLWHAAHTDPHNQGDGGCEQDQLSFHRSKYGQRVVEEGGFDPQGRILHYRKGDR